ncbi:helix-turn-helix domain-containing protein [Sphingomonas sp. MMS24-JH45]
MGNSTGLTPVHVNRTLRRLKELGLLDRKGRKITILDRPGLDALASRRRIARRSKLDWLPPTRAVERD